METKTISLKLNDEEFKILEECKKAIDNEGWTKRTSYSQTIRYALYHLHNYYFPINKKTD